MAIVALVKAYNSEKIIAECLGSLQGKVDRIVVADGWYPDANPVKYKPGNGSTDQTEAIAKMAGAQWIPAPPQPYSDEATKMNRMLQELQDGDWVFWIDTDERLHGDVHDAVNDSGSSSDAVPVKITTPDSYIVYARLFRYRKGIRMVRHWTISRDGGPELNLYMGPLEKRFWLEHLPVKAS